MRIGIMCLASFGGSARIATELATKLAQRGHKVHLFARTSPFNNKNFAPGITLHIVKPDRGKNIHPANLHLNWPDEEVQTFLSRIFNVIATEGLDILHFHYAVPFAFFAAEVKRALGNAAPVVVGTLHGTDVSKHGQDPATGPRLTEILSHVDALTTVSTSHARLSARLFGLPKLPQVIPNFIDLRKFQPAANLFLKSVNGNGSRNGKAHRRADFAGFNLSPVRKMESGLPSGDFGGLQSANHYFSDRVLNRLNGKSRRRKPRIAHVSNFRPVKDTRSVAEIFLGIRNRMDAELWLIGEGPEMDAVKSVLQHAGVENNVKYCGLRQSVAPVLAQTDLLLMTSLSESFCLAALEAMACGVPALSTNVGGVSEVVKHGKTGFLFPVGNNNLAVNMAVKLLSNPAKHQKMQQNAVRRALLFDHNQIVPIYERLYRRLLYRRINKLEPFLGNISSFPRPGVGMPTG